MRVLHAAAEIFPLVKTGGLADVIGALPQALLAQGNDVRIVLPGLPAILQGLNNTSTVCELGAIFGAGRVRLLQGVLASSQIRAYVIDAPFLYQRAGDPYQDAQGQVWPDNLQRFGLLSWVAAHLACGELDPSWRPEVLNAHDWHTALSFAYLQAHPGNSPATVFTIHNLAYQGLFSAGDFHLLGLPSHFMQADALEFHGQISFMKAGIAYAQKVTTVSPSYAREILTTEFGCGLEGALRARSENLSGILNGVDGTIWNPSTDPFIAHKYSAAAVSGKSRCKLALQQEADLIINEKAMLFGVVSRLTQQKGLDLLLECMPRLLSKDSHVQFVIQGKGDTHLEKAFSEAALQYPGRVAVRLAYDEALAHRIMAGADAIVVPSRFEPCGLTQLYALRYGAVPVVRAVGGLADTVIDIRLADPIAAPSNASKATGFSFAKANSGELDTALQRAINNYRKPVQWRQIMLNGMAQDFSWNAAAKHYSELYQQAVSLAG